jgi:hypothetical protein
MQIHGPIFALGVASLRLHACLHTPSANVHPKAHGVCGRGRGGEKKGNGGANLGQCMVVRLLAKDRPTGMTAPDKQQSTSVGERTMGCGTNAGVHTSTGQAG